MNDERRQAIEIFVHDARLRRERPFVTRLAKRLGVTPKAIYDWEKQDSDVARCLADLKAIREATRLDGSSHTPESSRDAQPLGPQDKRAEVDSSERRQETALSDADLAAHAQQAIRRMRMLIQQASGLVEHRGNLPDLPFLVYKLEETFPRMQKVLHDMRGYRDEWQRRYEPEVKVEDQPNLL